jgi:hypothetical protein
VTWRLKAGIWPSGRRRFAEHIPLVTRNRPLLVNGLVSTFPWQRINTEEQSNRRTLLLGDLYSVRMKLAQSEIQRSRSRIRETRHPSRSIRQTSVKYSIAEALPSNDKASSGSRLILRVIVNSNLENGIINCSYDLWLVTGWTTEGSEF